MLTITSSEEVYVEFVEVPERLRPMNEERVEAIAASIKEIGLRTPISVRDINDGERVVLVAGRHRLEAAVRLGWEKIAVDFVEGDEDDFRLWEIAENLHRAELAPLERSEHIAEWIRLTEKPAQLAQVSSGGRGKQSGISAASREIGVPRREAQRALKIDSITPEAKQACREAKIDKNQSALLRVAAAPPERQPDVAREVASAGSVAALRRAQEPKAEAHQAVERLTAERRPEPEDAGSLAHLAAPRHDDERTVTYHAYSEQGREERTVTFPRSDGSADNPMVAHLKKCWRVASDLERDAFWLSREIDEGSTTKWKLKADDPPEVLSLKRKLMERDKMLRALNERVEHLQKALSRLSGLPGDVVEEVVDDAIRARGRNSRKFPAKIGARRRQL